MRNQLIIIIFVTLTFIKSFYQLNERAAFEYDQEYLALAAKSLLIDKKLTLIGAPTSVGDIFIGPLYTYVAAFFIWIFRFHPLAITTLTALWDPLTIALLFFIILNLFDLRTATVTSLLALGSFAFNNVNFNPPLVHGLPVLSLVILFSLIRAIKMPKYLYLTALALGLSWQLHFSSLILAVLSILFILLLKGRPTLKTVLIALGIYFIFILPTILFDLRHDFLNIRHLLSFLLLQPALSPNNSLSPLLFLKTTLSEFSFLLSFHKFQDFSKIISLVSLPIFFSHLGAMKKSQQNITFLFFLWVICYLGITGLYSGKILPYYLLPLELPLFLVLAISLLKILKDLPSLGMLLLILYLLINFQQWVTFTSTLTLKHKLETLEFIKKNSHNQPIYLSLTLDKGYEGGFKYLEWYLQLNTRDDRSLPIYTLVVPYNWIEAKLDYRSGGVGVILPKKKIL